MNCPRNSFGQPLCNVVTHPDYPHLESFCSACDRRFPPDSPFIHPWALFLALIMALLVVNALKESDRPPSSPRPQSMQSQSMQSQSVQSQSMQWLEPPL